MSLDIGQVESTKAALAATILYTGGPQSLIQRVLQLADRSYERSGIRGFASLIKGWSKSTRSLLSGEPLDSTAIGYCKKASNCRFALRQAGLSEAEIDSIVLKYDGVCGIPPFLLDPTYCRALLPDPSFEDVSRIVPFANIGRCAPPADSRECATALENFWNTTSRNWPVKFDFSSISSTYADLCDASHGSISRWEASRHSSFDYSRGKEGKLGETTDRIVEEFLYSLVGDIVPTDPEGDLFDIFGNLVVDYKEWDPTLPILDVFYPHYRSSERLDGRFGLFGMLWAIHDIHERFPGQVTSNSPYISIGRNRPVVRFSGTVPCRVVALPEEGWKARVITITPLSVAILQIILRHILDPHVRSDPLVKVGLLSKVKLYDLMFSINGSRDGLVDTRPSFFYRSCESVDLTTATDSPYRESVYTILNTFVNRVLCDDLVEFRDLVLDLALSGRTFPTEQPPTWSHKCGIMMGEAMSGVYLNVMSGIIRCTIDQFQESFDFYAGSSIDDADEFILHHRELIQDWLDSTWVESFDPDSSQSGDDLIRFSHSEPGEQKRFLVLLYRVFGLIPSHNTFYSSDRMGTFTEEFCVKTRDSFGWTFVDLLKPRLFTSIATKDGIESILSRIRQITSILKYRAWDLDLVLRVSDAVDGMIESNHVLRDRIKKYEISEALPPFLGGLDHPIQFSPDWYYDVPEEDLQLVANLLTCSEEEFLDVRYHWIFEDLEDLDAQNMRIIMRNVYSVFTSLEHGDDSGNILPLHLYNESDLLKRDPFPSYSVYSRELSRLKSDLGMANLDEIIQVIFSGLRLEQELNGVLGSERNPLIQLRNRREFLISRAKTMNSAGSFEPGMIGRLHERFRTSYRGKITLKSEFLDVVGFDSLPTMTLPVLPFDRRSGPGFEPPLL